MGGGPFLEFVFVFCFCFCFVFCLLVCLFFAFFEEIKTFFIPTTCFKIYSLSSVRKNKQTYIKKQISLSSLVVYLSYFENPTPKNPR